MSEFKAVRDELVKYVKLRELLASTDLDERALLDTLEGETNLHEAIAEVAQSALEDEAMAAGLAEYIDSLRARSFRLQSTAERKRGLLVMAMEKAALKTIKQPAVTITLKPIKPGLVINDEAKIPARFFRTPEPVIDKKAIKAELESGAPVDGASLSNGGITVQIRSI